MSRKPFARDRLNPEPSLEISFDHGQMARYYFDVNDGKRFTLDEQGIGCASLDEVRYSAVDALPDMARDELPNGNHLMMTGKVRDAYGEYLLEASLTSQMDRQRRLGEDAGTGHVAEKGPHI